MRMRGGRVRRGRVVTTASEVKSWNLTRYPAATVRLQRSIGGGTPPARNYAAPSAVGPDSTGGALWKPASQRSRSRSVCGSDWKKRRCRTARRPGSTCPAGESQLMFCNMGSIRVRQLMQRGDERPLATEVTLEGLQVPAVGVYDLVNAYLSVNGSIHVRVDAETEVVPARDLVQKG